MSHTYHKIWIHLIWSTKEREKMIYPELKKKLIYHIKENGKENEIYIDSINGIEDHIHLLIGLNPTQALSKVVNQIKGESSHWINDNKLVKGHFFWQEGYAAFSLGESQVKRARKYIYNQEKHHKKIGFMEELSKFLKAYGLSSMVTP
ncbi:MAG: IS200/IS605 family transposase [Candidatus Cloacimonetes bacterium]|nr:IS200/IS605 family transposase [Candidatus Cloacimonadota bacterium]